MFNIQAYGNEATIFIYGDIGSDFASESVSAAEFIRQLNDINASEINVRINSVGGSVPDAIGIFNALVRHPAKIVVSIDGVAASSASMVAMAGDVVQMASNGVLMIHAPWSNVTGNASELRESANTLDRWADAMAASYSRKTRKGTAHAKALLNGEDHYFSAEEALAEGFIDEIIEPLAIAAYQRIPTEAAERFLSPQCLSEAQREEFTMPKPATPTEAKEAEWQAKERSRRADIRGKFKGFETREGVPELLNQCLDDPTITAASAADRLLAKLGEACEPVAGDYVYRDDNSAHDPIPSIRTLPSGRDRYIEDATACLLTRAGVADKETRIQASRSSVRSLTLVDHAKLSLERAGESTRGLDPMKIAGTALTQTTSDFPVLLENTMHKALLNAYATHPDTWSMFCKVGSVRDFRAHSRYRTGSLGNYDTINEAGEFINKAIPDGEKATVQVDTRGNLINISRKSIVNDDMGAFITLAVDLGRAGKRTVEAAVYALLAENSGLGPTMADALPLFDAGHSNISTGAALSAASIDADRVVMGSQTDVSGNDFLFLRPSVWLGPLGSGSTARTINDAQYDPDTANKLQKPNSVRGLFNQVVDTPRLSGTRYYLFADPMQAPVIEVAFLNGVQEPEIEQQSMFSVDGVAYRARLDFGVAAIDYRGAVTNAGA